MTTVSFQEYAASAEARKKIEEDVAKYSQMLCEALMDDFKRESTLDYKFYLSTGRKYFKVIMECNDGARSVHAFINRKTGEVYKAASWRGPAEHVRYDLRLIKDREYLFENADWAGGYLYM